MGIRNLHTRTIKYHFSAIPWCQFGICFLFLFTSLYLNGQSTCSNVTDGGAIMGTEMGCANPLFDPENISSIALPTGGSGTIQYLWMKTTGDPSAPFNTWTIIPGAKNASYDPLPIDQTTYYARCSRRSGCSDYNGETDYITKEVRCCNFNGTIISPSASACAGTPTNLSVASPATGLSYQWEATSGTFDNAISATPIFIGTSTGTAVITVRLSNGTCSEVISTSLQIQSSIEVQITPSASTACEGGSINLTANGAVNDQYIWTSTGGTFNNANSSSPIFSATTAGVYLVTLNLTTTSGCQGTATIPITIGSLTANATVTNASCSGDDGAISIAVTGGGAPYQYDWGDRFGNVPTISNLESGIYIVIITDSEGCSTTTSAEVTSSADLTATLVIQKTSCAGTSDGAIDVSISGGQAPYTILWDNNIGAIEDPTGLSAGVYNVEIRDQGGCVVNQVAIVGEESALNIAFETTDVSCGGSNDGTILLTASLGVAPYSYTWANNISNGPTANNLAAGTYQVTVEDATGCSNIANMTIVEPAPINMSITATSSCSATSGVASVVVTGGSPSYTYIWNDAAQQTSAEASNLTAGTYTVTVTDNSGCTATATTTIEIDGNSDLNLTTKTESSCAVNSGVAEVIVSGGNSTYTYLWNDPNGQTSARATTLTSGVYTVTVTNAIGCTATATATIEIDGNSDLNLTTKTENTCVVNSGVAEVIVSGGNSTYTYLWNDPNGQTNARATTLTSGVYTVTVTNAAGCTATATATISIDGNGGLVATTSAVNSCGPNSGSLSVSVTGGTPTYSYAWSDGQTTAQAINLPDGTYTVTVTDNSSCVGVATGTITSLAPLSIELLPTPTTCNGGATGTLNLSVSNGTGPFTYTWSNNLPNQTFHTGLPEGIYQVTVTDANGCTGVAETTIRSEAGFDITVNTENATCQDNNGRAVVTINGAPDNYTYRWNDFANQTTSSATGLAPAIYSVTVTGSNGCTISKDAPISRTSSTLSASIFPTNATVCMGTPVAFSSDVVGAPISYSWAADSGTFDDPSSPNPNYIGTANGTHTITLTIRDGTNCEVTASSTVTVIAPSGGQISTADNVAICVDDDISSVINVSISGNVGNANSWLVTDISGNIIAVQSSPIFDLDKGGEGICFIQNVAYSKTLTTGLIPGNNISAIQGCFALSNSIRVEKLSGNNCPLICDVIPTTIQSNSTPSICADDGISDLITISSTGPIEQTALLIMDENNTILSIPTTATFDVEGMRGGRITVVEINYKGAITGLAAGNNVAQITGCFVISNPLTINLQVGPECPNFCGVEGGVLSSANVTNFCVGDGIDDLIDVALIGNSGAYSTWVVTDIHERILSLQTAPPFNFEGTGEGTCFIWHISSREPLNNLVVGTSLNDLVGCFALSSNSIEVNRSLPQAVNIVPSAALNCRGVPLQFTTNLTGSTLSFEWTSEAGIFDDANSASPNLTINEAGIYIVSVSIRDGICTSIANTTIHIQNDIELAYEVTNTQCTGSNNGSIVLTPIGGTAPYTYAWANGLGTSASLSGLAEGTYNVTLTDAIGCSVATNINIALASNISVRLETQNLACHQNGTGGIVATALGGVEPYAFIWNGKAEATNALSGLAAGEYTIEVTDALNCSASIKTTLTEPPALTSLLTAEAANCNQGGSISAQVTGGTGTYNYEWSATNSTNTPTLGNLSEGTYGVSISDQNACTITEFISVGKVGITQCALRMTRPVLTLNGNEGGLEMQVNGGSQYIYAWNTGATSASIDQLAHGTYSATVTDEFGCSCADTLELQNPAKIGNLVFEDKNDNGLQDVGEVGLRGVHIELTGTTTRGNLVVQDVRTDKNGMYMFVVPAGQYKITVLDYLNLKVSTPNAGDDNLDSDLDPISFMSETIFLFGGEYYDHLDIGLVPKGFCDNVLGGGTIAADEEICAPNGNPELMYNVTYPTGGSGEIEYLWLMSHKPEYTPDDPDWLEIPNTNEEYYDPAFIAGPTYYVRCARRKGCDNYPGETPVIAKTLVNCIDDAPIAEALRIAIIDNEIELAWNGIIPMEHSNFVIERSENGIDFSVISSTKAFYSKSYTNYDYMDKTPLVGENYYRIKTVHPDFEPSYSNIAMAMRTPTKDMRVMIYPNPVLQDVTIHFLEELEEETAVLDIANGFGQIIRQVKIEMPTKKYTLNMGDLPGGMYYLKFQNRSLKRYSQKIFKKE